MNFILEILSAPFVVKTGENFPQMEQHNFRALSICMAKQLFRLGIIMRMVREYGSVQRYSGHFGKNEKRRISLKLFLFPENFQWERLFHLLSHQNDRFFPFKRKTPLGSEKNFDCDLETMLKQFACVFLVSAVFPMIGYLL